jgi:hypothetical protein
MGISHRTFFVIASFGVWIGAAAWVCETGAGRHLLPEASASRVKVSQPAGKTGGAGDSAGLALQVSMGDQ